MTNSRTPTSSKNWRKRSGEELELPSGNVCLVKRPGMDRLLKAGIMPDSLTPIVLEQLRQADSGGRPAPKQDEDKLNQEIMERILEDPNGLTEIMATFDRVVVMCVVEPKVAMHTYTAKDALAGLCTEDEIGEDIPEEKRLSDEVPQDSPLYSADPPLYTDEIDQDDKQFIFQFVVGGDRDLESFRQEQARALEGS